MEFSDWINAQFMKWQGNRRRTITEFAAYLGVKQPALSMWMKLEKGSKPDYKNAAKVAEKLGPEIWDVLGLSRPEGDQTPEGLRLVRRMAREMEDALRARNLTGDMPEVEQILTEIAARYGFVRTGTNMPNSGEKK